MSQERDFLKGLPRRHPEGGIGIGDDTALLPQGLLATVDTLVENRHFILSDINLEQLAYKLLAVNVSDIASMGGTPTYALLSIVCGPGFKAREFTKALFAECDKLNVLVIGGDTNSGSETSLTLTLMGQPSSVVTKRSEARPGDVIMVTGALGGAVALGRHLSPPIRLKEAQFFIENGVICMMDLSDGLAQGVHCLAQEAVDSELCFVIEEESLPLHEDSEGLTHEDRVEAALYEGEDFELLLTASPHQYREISKGPFEVHKIGYVESGSGVKMKSVSGDLKDLPEGGYEHVW